MRIIYDSTNTMSVLTAALLNNRHKEEGLPTQPIEVSEVDQILETDFLVGVYSFNRLSYLDSPNQIYKGADEKWLIDTINKPITLAAPVHILNEKARATQALESNTYYTVSTQMPGGIDLDYYYQDVKEIREIYTNTQTKQLKIKGIVYKVKVIRLAKELWDIAHRNLSFNKAINFILVDKFGNNLTHRLITNSFDLKEYVLEHCVDLEVGKPYNYVTTR